MKARLATAFLLSISIATAASAAPPRTFVRDAIKGDNGEIRLGALAERQAGSRAVQDYGRRLNRDHANAKAQVIPVARAFGVAPPAAMTPDALNAYNHLSRLHGRAFDRQFVSHMISDHRKDIAKFEAQARTGDRRTAALARKQLPVLREHLRIAESLAR